MIWMTWQQHRWQAFLGGAAFVLLTLFLLLTGLHMAADYQQMGVASCLSSTSAQNTRCTIIIGTFQQHYGNIATLVMLLLMLMPVVVSILVGAPLVAREVEQGTHLLAWTQGITRQRWLAVKLTAILLAGVLASTGVTILLSWWRTPLDQLQSPLTPVIFDVKGIVPVAAMVFALSLAIAAGTLVRRTILAIGITIVIYLAIFIPAMDLRFYVLPPTTVTWDMLTQASPAINQGTGWVIDHGELDHQGHVVSDVTVNSTCDAAQSYGQCLHDHGWLVYNVYQPTNHFWTLQGIEASLFFVLTVGLLAFTFWWTQYRIR